MAIVADLPGTGSDGWSRQTFGSIDQHYAALKRVRPALGWTSRQLARGGISGTVISSRNPRFAVTCTSAAGGFEMRGPASTDHVVLSLALVFPTVGLQWMQPVQAGMVGVYQPGKAVDAINRDSVSFVVIDISRDELERETEREGNAINPAWLSGSGVAPGCVSPDSVARITRLVSMLHRGDPVGLPPGLHLDGMILSTIIHHLARAGDTDPAPSQTGLFRIVDRARAYIEAQLDNSIAIDDLVAAAATSRRTLHRAFNEVLGETPQSYVLKLRLNRIRSDLASPQEAERTVTMVSHRWGIAELGKLSARYRAQFGELPRETLARHRTLHPLAQTA
jgi:AraC-like DNA-binding protein